MADPLKASRAAEQAAYAAGTHLQASRSRLAEVVVTHQLPADVATAIEREAQGLIRDVLLHHFPDHGFVTEPEAAGGEALVGDRPRWVVNAIAGAANYLRGYPQYAVSIALVEAGEPLLGVVYDPCRNEFFGALCGRGAVLNGQAIRCAPPRPTADALAATVFPSPSSRRMPAYIAEFGRVLRGFGGLRRSGSTALELAYLAAGRIDGFWAVDTAACDTAAGILLLRESGALIEARDGLPWMQSRALTACTPTLHRPLLALLNAA